MSISEQPDASDTRPGDHGRAGDPAWRLVEGLCRGFHASAVYDVDHPAVVDAARAALAALGELIGTQSEIRLRVVRGGFLPDCDQADHSDPESDDTDLLIASEEIQRFAVSLIDQDIAAIEFSSLVTLPDMQALIALVWRGSAHRQRLAEFDPDTVSGLHEHIRLIALNYATIHTSEGAKSEDDDAGDTPRTAESLWRDLVHLSTLFDGSEDAPDPAVLAERVNTSFECDDGASVRDLRDQLRTVSQSIPSSGSGQRDPEQLARLRGFVEGLNPSIRKTLLSVDRSRPEPWMNTLTEFADAWPTGELVDALEQLDRSEREPSAPAFMLFTRLATIALDDPGQCERLRTLSTEWTSSDDKTADSNAGGHDGEDVSELFGSLEQLLRSASDFEFSPDDYHAQLMELSQLAGEVSSQIDLSELDDPVDLRVRASDIASRVLQAEMVDGLEPGGLLEHGLTAMDDLIACQRFDVLCSYTLAARRILNETGADPAAHACAHAFLDAIQDEKRVARLIEHIRNTDDLSDDLSELLRAVGASAFAMVLELLNTCTLPILRAKLAKVTAGSEHTSLANTIMKMIHDDSTAVAQVLTLLEHFEGDQIGAVLTPLLYHGEQAVRRSGFHLLSLSRAPWPTKSLHRALREHDSVIHEHALHQLQHGCDETTAPLLVSLLTAAQDPLSPRLFDLALNAITASSDAIALDALCAILDGVAENTEAVRSGFPARVAALLEPHKANHPEARRALRRWARSPARLKGIIKWRHGNRESAA